MSPTKRNLIEVKDSAPEFGFSDIGEAHFAMGEPGEEGLEYLAFGLHHQGDGALNHDPGFWD